jgi:hypothetical protein
MANEIRDAPTRGRKIPWGGLFVQDFTSLPGDWGLNTPRHARFINPPWKADGRQSRRNRNPHFPRRQ